MADNHFMEEVATLKQVIQEASRIRDYSGEEMEELINQKLSERIDWAKEHDPDLYWYYQNLLSKRRTPCGTPSRSPWRGWESWGKSSRIRRLRR